MTGKKSSKISDGYRLEEKQDFQKDMLKNYIIDKYLRELRAMLDF